MRTAARIEACLVVAVALCIDGPETRGESPAPPNFVFVLVDDQGWNGTSVAMDGTPDSRSDYHQTPHLERLARGGMRFSQGYSPAGLCCPTRRSIQFGQTPLRQGDDAEFAARYPVGNQRPTIPRLLKAVDPRYATAHFGKWDLRTDLSPQHLGYDEGDGNTTNGEGSLGDRGAPDPIDKSEKWSRHIFMQDPKRIFSITGRATDFIRRMTSAGRPFFVQVSHYAVHVDFQTRAATFDKYEQVPGGNLHHHTAFAAMKEDLDTGLGKLLDTLDELGIAQNTYVIYLSDNGAVPWIPPDRVKHLSNPLKVADRGRNHPLRAGKWTVFEGGIRVPFVIRGPGIESGSVCEAPVVGWDLLPTIVDLTGYQPTLPQDLDGVSFEPLLRARGQEELKRQHPLVFHRYSDSYGHSAIRIGKYKLVRFRASPFRTNDDFDRIKLFDLDSDTGETTNLASKLPATSRELQSALTDYLRRVDANSPARSPD